MNNITNKHKIIPAYHMIRQSLGDGFIEDQVNEILAIIEDDIKQAIDRKQTVSCTEISTTFSIPSMPNWRAQRYVYFHVLRALKNAQYYPRIIIQGKKAEDQQVYIHVK